MPIGDERKAQSLPTSNASRAGRVLTNAQIAVPCAGRAPSNALRHRCKVMTLTPSVRAISLCNFPCLAKRFACASFFAISALECCFFCLGIPVAFNHFASGAAPGEILLDVRNRCIAFEDALGLIIHAHQLPS
jgi:hypothetical protein